ncbi:MAG: acetyl-CoA hydrolase/transferase C-terminal domain-containing protein [Crocinitomicaceae bacterium]
MERFNHKTFTAEEAVKIIKSNDRIFLHSAAATPSVLIQAMTDRASELDNVEIVSIHTEGPVPYADEQFANNFKINTFFAGSNIRKHVQSGRANYIPIFLSEIPHLLRTQKPIDVALINVSMPNKKGFCSLGCSVDISNTAIDVAKHIIAQVNPQMPFVHGHGIIHMDEIDALVQVDEPLYEAGMREPTAVDLQIGKNIAELIEDRSCLQMGIGAIPNAVLACLGNHKDLGIHSEMISDGVVDLYEKGAITGHYKMTRYEKIVASFAYGTRKIYDFIDDNPIVNMMDVAYVNDPAIISRNPKTVAINSAIEVDVFGQTCADSIGTKHYSGVGGQMDFIRGAAHSEGGKPILALPSITKDGKSKIVSAMGPGTPVVTTRAHVHYIVTEFGVAYLHGKNLKERAEAMIQIAHPDHREQLEKEVWEIFKQSMTV